MVLDLSNGLESIRPPATQEFRGNAKNAESRDNLQRTNACPSTPQANK
jgi:hypothetical protein